VIPPLCTGCGAPSINQAHQFLRLRYSCNKHHDQDERLRIRAGAVNPLKWSDAYELQKRTGYVFCPREVVPVISLASKIVFLGRFGVTMAKEADGYIKATPPTPSIWLGALVAAKVIDQETSDHLSSHRHSLVAVVAENLKIPDSWIQEDPDIAPRLAAEINKQLSGGLIAEHIDSLGEVLAALYAFTDAWFESGKVTGALESEEALQRQLRECFTYRNIKTEEGSKVGGGKLDLFAADAVLIENKFHGMSAMPAVASPAARMQGRRYAIALSSQIVIVVVAYKASPGLFPTKSSTLSIHEITSGDHNRVEIRITLPYGAVVPSREIRDESIVR
jgi:hypothetical protein